MINHKSSAFTIIAAIGDTIAGIIAYYLAWYIRESSGFGIFRGPIPAKMFSEVHSALWLVIISQVGLLYIFGFYRDRVINKDYFYWAKKIVPVCILQLMIISSVYYLAEWFYPRSVLMVFAFLNILLLTGWRALLKRYISDLFSGITQAKACGYRIEPTTIEPTNIESTTIESLTDDEKLYPALLDLIPFKSRVIPYFKEKPGAPFIITFMILLMSCAFLLIFKKEKIAEAVANWAYLFLVVGVIIELVQTIRYSRKDNSENNK